MLTMSNVQSEDKPVSMSIKRGTKERLRRLGEKDESYDDVISNLLDVSAKAYEEQRKETRKKS
jgi:hypothetical protein